MLRLSYINFQGKMNLNQTRHFGELFANLEFNQLTYDKKNRNLEDICPNLYLFLQNGPLTELRANELFSWNNFLNMASLFTFKSAEDLSCDNLSSSFGS